MTEIGKYVFERAHSKKSSQIMNDLSALAKVVGSSIINKTDDFINCTLTQNDKEIIILNIPPKSGRKLPSNFDHPHIKSIAIDPQNSTTYSQIFSRVSQQQRFNSIYSGAAILTSDSSNISSDAVIYFTECVSYGYFRYEQNLILFSLIHSKIKNTCSLSLYNAQPYEVNKYDGTYIFTDTDFIFTLLSSQDGIKSKLILTFSKNSKKQVEQNDSEFFFPGITYAHPGDFIDFHGSTTSLQFTLNFHLLCDGLFLGEITFLESVKTSSLFGAVNKTPPSLFFVNETEDPPLLYSVEPTTGSKFFSGKEDDGSYQEAFLLYP